MAEPNTPAQPQTPGAPGGASMRDYFMNQLAAESGEAPSQDVQPQDHETDVGEPSEAQPGLEAEGSEELDQEDPSQDAQPEDEEYTPFTIDGTDYGPEEVQELLKQNQELRRRTGSEWREQAETAAHRKREFESRMELLDVQDKQYQQLATANLSQYANMDTSKFTPEQFQQYHQARQQAEMGYQRLQQYQESEAKKRLEAREQFDRDQINATVKYLEATEPRWGPEFYGKILEFAVNELGYTEEEANNVTDVRGINGLKAQYDLHLLQHGEPVEREPKKPTKRKQRQTQKRRNAKGQFESAKQAAFDSKNARADGSFREMKRRELAMEANRGSS